MLSACLVTSAAGRTQPVPTIAIASRYSHAEFGLRVLWIGKVIGRLDALRGTIHVYPDGKARVDVTVDSRVLRMRQRDYENFARSTEFFDSARYPSIDFRSQPFPLDRLAEGGSVQGALTLRGITRDVRFQLLPERCPVLARIQAQVASVASQEAPASSASMALASPSPAGMTVQRTAARSRGDLVSSSRIATCRVLARGFIQRTRFGMTAHRFVIGNRIELGLVLRLEMSDTGNAPAPAGSVATSNPAMASSANPRPR